ncbi:hypothetical protein BC941DRAFT_234631 [Chlamydoabsidia padenii]|nr:hypothetical protein BC941DRAFT_234631 [Chlamydoabsidia padenii]
MTLNTAHVTKNPILFGSALVTTIGWSILFIGACVSGYGGVVWWIIIYELILLLGIIYVLMNAILSDYRILILSCLAISVTLLTQTIDNQLHIGLGSAKASAGGGIMIIIIQFFWILVFGSSPESSIHGTIFGANYHDKEGVMPLSAPVNYPISQYDSVHSGIAISPPNSNDAKMNAIALHPYTANPDDPNELSFHKGEILEILDRRGNWWQARKQDQTIGIVPSNYFAS